MIIVNAGVCPPSAQVVGVRKMKEVLLEYGCSKRSAASCGKVLR